jgi:hypothetical protein
MTKTLLWGRIYVYFWLPDSEAVVRFLKTLVKFTSSCHMWSVVHMWFLSKGPMLPSNLRDPNNDVIIIARVNLSLDSPVAWSSLPGCAQPCPPYL